MRVSSRSETCGLRYTPPRGHHAQGFQQIRVGGAFQNEGARAGADGAHHRVLVVVHGEDHDLAVGVVAQDLRRGLDAVQTGQADVHQHQVGPKPLARTGPRRARFGFADHAKFVAAAQDGLDAIAHDLVIIHEQDVEGHNGSKQLYPVSLARPRRCRRDGLAGPAAASSARGHGRVRSIRSRPISFRAPRTETARRVAERSAAARASAAEAASYTAAAASGGGAIEAVQEKRITPAKEFRRASTRLESAFLSPDGRRAAGSSLGSIRARVPSLARARAVRPGRRRRGLGMVDAQ